MESKKELKQKYKEMKTPMGIIMIKNTVNGKVFIDSNSDTKSIINRHRFQLKAGSHRIKELQQDWKEYGEAVFTFEVLEELSYDEKEENKDYGEELEIMKLIWIDMLSKNDPAMIYKK